ncbi:MAG: zinc ribbon domain-containing protein [Lachnospiraceae bacterium]|nr:zinc ribbon domain-containing protein [Lachnospiraceae bacterium]
MKSKFVLPMNMLIALVFISAILGPVPFIAVLVYVSLVESDETLKSKAKFAGGIYIIYKIIDELLGLGASVFRLPVTRDTDYDSFWYSAEAVMNKIDSFIGIVFVVFFLVMAVISLFGVAVNTPDIPDLSNIGQAQAKPAPQAAQPVQQQAPVQNPAPQAAQVQATTGKTCPKCGAPVSDGTAFCTKCGNKIG